MKWCPDCTDTYMCGVEYAYPSPEQYDGVSEWQCPKCGLRIGRWTKKRLATGEAEPRYGVRMLECDLDDTAGLAAYLPGPWSRLLGAIPRMLRRLLRRG